MANESSLNQSERVAVSLTALRVHESRPLQEKLSIIARALKAGSVAAALAVVMTACGAPPPPETFSVDSSFSLEQQGAIRDAVDAWCDAAGWCPAEVLYAERAHFRLVEDIEEDEASRAKCPEGMTCETGGTNTGDEIVIARNGIPSLDTLWFVAAHEAGHFCAGHTREGLMSGYHPAGASLSIDAVAVAAWKAGCP